METAPGKNSETVFKRNISLTTESYVLDFQMLQVLGKIDGARSLAAVAAALNEDIAAVKETCGRLLSQRLILPARPRAPSLPQSSRGAPSPQPAAAPPRAVSAPSPKTPRNVEPGRRRRPGASPAPPETAPQTPPGGARRAPAAPAGSDIFSIARPPGGDSLGPGPGAFAAVSGTTAERNAPGLFTRAVPPPEKPAAPAPAPVRVDGQALAHFEAGLASLQRGALEDALHQFELALKIDPRHRLCRANIQRIRAKLGRDR